jgi:putative spermidine/putrescine transport system ATP-binding protein
LLTALSKKLREIVPIPMLQLADPASMTAQPLTLDGVTHSYGAGLAVDNVTLEVKGGELIALLGPSGCGKTTLLRIVAGFIRQSNGKVIIGDRSVDTLPPNRREIGIVFQNYALFPHMSVAQNIAYGLAATRKSSEAYMTDCNHVAKAWIVFSRG